MSRRTRNLFAWKTRTEDGRKRHVEAQLFGSQWTVTSRCADEEEWTTHDPILLEDLEELYDMLLRKYQRKHLSWDKVKTVEKLLEARGKPPES